ncbi:Glycerol-3-phosphate acyltransferase [subsurface metagenome]
MAIEFGLLIVGAYLLGSVPTAYLVGKWFRGIDIRQYGSGNVGVTNLLRLTSKRLGIPVIIFDLGKGAVMVWAAQFVGLSISQQVIVGLAAIVGHNWTVFLRFNGGRGVLTTLGIVLTLSLLNNNNLVPWGILAFCVIFLGNAFIIHNVPLGVGTGIAALPLVNWGVGEPLPLTLGYLAMLVILIVRRLMAPRTSFTATVPRRQLLINRLLFDRDIRDREAWIHRVSEQQKERGEG